ncbi:MAG: AAA family ATPase [Thermoplasmata archaeon]|nr:MAG: AAA family ATPase [Thermoplasmata archaeon]
MNTLIIAAVNRESGKTVVALGIALNHPGKVDYIKPIRGTLMKVDEEVHERDAYLVHQALGLEGTGSEVSPISLGSSQGADADSLVAQLSKLAEGSDLLLVETGQTAEMGLNEGVSAFDLAKAMGEDLLLVTDADVYNLDTVLMMCTFAENRGVGVMGVVVNNDQDGRLAELVRAKGIPVLGTIPYEPRLRTFRVQEILDEVGGECVAGSGGLDRMVENVVIGAMTVDTALPIMRRIPRKCVITGGDRSDLQLAALTTDVSALVLTGGIRPNSHVMAEAHEQDIPIIVISGHTYQVAERFERLESRINPEDEEMMVIIKDLIGNNVDMSLIR